MSGTDKKQQLAEAVGRAMMARDRASQALGMELMEIGPGHARLRMRVRGDMLNGHGTCHGGFLFSLADSAFAFACNARNEVTVALACQISFVAPAEEGDLLEAEAVEKAAGGRTGVFDVEVRNAQGALIAVFRGNAYRTRGSVMETEDEPPST
jgi:acyl-CoA thioesterase